MIRKIFLIILIALSFAALTVADPFKYKRSAFIHWADFDRDCQTSRAETLIRYNMGVISFKTDKNCLVIQGTWLCPYTGQVFYQARKLDIDHIIPLKWAWDHGAYDWTKEKRKQFANDPENLLAVEARANRQKSAQGPLTWLPPNQIYRAAYLLKWEYLKTKYDLNK